MAAAVHAGYHLLLKSADEKPIFTWWSLALGAAIFSPLLLSGGAWAPRIWLYALVSAAVEVGYFMVLASAYRLADFSVAYPLARGTAPALLAAWAVLWLGERPNAAGLAGLATLVGGLLLVGAQGRAAGRLRPGPGVAAALLAALLISVYSAIDGAAVRLTAAAAYTALVLGLTALLMTPAMLWRYPAGRLIGVLRGNWRRILLVGPMMMISYGLVLFAFSRGSVAYAGAVREVSIIFAALAGWLWLGERAGPARIGGAALICTGIVVIALAG